MRNQAFQVAPPTSRCGANTSRTSRVRVHPFRWRNTLIPALLTRNDIFPLSVRALGVGFWRGRSGYLSKSSVARGPRFSYCLLADRGRSALLLATCWA
jgi:hypothetical protein